MTTLEIRAWNTRMENIYKMTTVNIQQAEVFCSRVGKCQDNKNALDTLLKEYQELERKEKEAQNND